MRLHRSSQPAVTLVAALAILSLWIAATIGWILNIVSIFQTIDAPLTGLFVGRCVGVIFGPLGAVLGYF